MLTRVHFTDARVGWVLGYDAAILQTADGGATWVLKHHDPKGRALYDLLFLDSLNAIAIGAYGTMLVTTDAGATWTARDNALTGLGMHLNTLQKLADGTLFIAPASAASWLAPRMPARPGRSSTRRTPVRCSGAMPKGDRGALVYGMRGNVYAAADLARLSSRRSRELGSLRAGNGHGRGEDRDARLAQDREPGARKPVRRAVPLATGGRPAHRRERHDAQARCRGHDDLGREDAGGRDARQGGALRRARDRRRTTRRRGSGSGAMSVATTSTGFTRAILRVVEPVIFGKRALTLTLLMLITLFFGWHSAQLRPNAGWLKMVPQAHPYMQTFMQYYQDFGGANTVLIALKNHKGDIYQPEFMETLRNAADDAFFIPGVDRARVNSIFSPSILYIEVVEGGLAGENVIPSDYAATPEMMARIRGNVAKANVIGRLVSEDQTTALIQLELLETDPKSGTTQDRADAAKPMTERLRAAWEGGTDTTAKLEAVSALLMKNEDAKAGLDYVQVGEALEKIRAKYETGDITVHIVGFAKVVDDMTKASMQVGVFFVVALLLMGLLLWIYIAAASRWR
jgi:hypothetical protein